MVLQPLISFVHGVIQGTWIVSAVVLKYVLVLQLFYAYRENGSSLENFSSEVGEYSRELVSILVVLGSLVYITGIGLTATLQSLSYVIAALYFGYLFWKF